MDFVEMDFIEDAERSQEDKEYNEIDMILQATRVDMTRLCVLMDTVSKRKEYTFKKHAYHDEMMEVMAFLLYIFRKNREKEDAV